MADLNEAYIGFGVGHDKRQRCCGAQYYQPNQFITVNGKQVSIPQIKSILERNKSLKQMNIKPHQPIWLELGLTEQEYRYIYQKLKK